jgi:hypothetical protein
MPQESQESQEPKKSQESLAAKKEIVTKRSFYRIEELLAVGGLSKKALSLNDIFDFAASGILTLSFPVSERYVVAGDYIEGKEEFEPPYPEDTFSGLLPLSTDSIWAILSEGTTTIEYLHRNEYEFRKILSDSGRDFPVVGIDQLAVTCEDWDRFNNGLAPKPNFPDKPEDPKIIGVLAYLYAEATGDPAFFTKQGRLVIEEVVKNISKLISDGSGEPLTGMSGTTVQGKISTALKLMEPKILMQQSKPETQSS